jgi:hypothetical protein
MNPFDVPVKNISHKNVKNVNPKILFQWLICHPTGLCCFMNFFDVTQIYPMKKVIFSSMVIFVIQSVSFFVNFFDLDLLCCL